MIAPRWPTDRELWAAALLAVGLIGATAAVIAPAFAVALAVSVAVATAGTVAVDRAGWA